VGVWVSDAGTLASRAGRALVWSFAGTAISRLSTLVIAVALARMLGPTEFGTYAVAMVALLAVLSFNELGVSLAIVRWPGEPREIAPTVATVSVVSSLLIYLGCFFGAPTFAEVMGEPSAVPVIRVLALGVVISGLVATPVAVLQRKFRQDRKVLVDLVTTWLSALTSIGCALAGWGAMSLAIGHLTGVAVGAVLFIVLEPSALRLGFDRRRARELLRFGLPLAGSSVVVFAVANVDRLIIGAVLGPVPLGIYVLAVNLSNWPIAVFSQPVRAVAPAALARLQGDPPAMRATFLSAAGLLAAVTVPACALLAGVSEPLIRLVYGSTWSGAESVLPWLAVLAALRILFELCYDFFVVLARTRVVLAAQLAWLAALVPCVLLGARWWGAWGAAAMTVAVAAVIVSPIYLYELRRCGIGLREVGSRTAWPMGLAVALALVAHWVTDMIADVLLGLVTAAALGALVIGALVHRMRDSLRALRDVDGIAPGTDVPTSSPVGAPAVRSRVDA
jgi:O-antigen/teichoic acid export membrane protein